MISQLSQPVYKLICDDDEFDIIDFKMSSSNKSAHGAFPSSKHYIEIVSDDISLYQWMSCQQNNPPLDYLLYNPENEQNFVLTYSKIVQCSYYSECDFSPKVEVELETMFVDINSLHELSLKYDIVKKIVRNKKINGLLDD